MPGDALFGPLLTTDELLEATGDRAWLAAILDAEAALALAEADVGVVSAEVADAVVTACVVERFDIAALGLAARAGGNPVIPLAEALRASSEWAHWGATSQDVLDTAATLVVRRAGAIVDAELGRLADACASLADAHRSTVMAGRTLLQQAVPITFGGKAALWLAAVMDGRRRLRDAVEETAVQLGGAAGTLASLGDDGPAVVDAFARRLRLPAPAVPWHTDRQRLAAVGAALGMVAGTSAKISGDVALLMQDEVGEVSEPAPGGSSSMPHKRNPVGAARVEAAARRAHALVPVLLGAMVAEHERGLGGWHAEWQALAELLALAGGAVATTATTLEGLVVDAAAMAANLRPDVGSDVGATDVWIDRALALHRAQA